MQQLQQPQKQTKSINDELGSKERSRLEKDNSKPNGVLELESLTGRIDFDKDGAKISLKLSFNS